MVFLEIFLIGFGSGARSRSSTNPTFTNFSLLLDFSGSGGFGTWRIFVPLFSLADFSLFSYCFGF